MKYKYHSTGKSSTAFLVLAPITDAIDSAITPLIVVCSFLDITFMGYICVYDVCVWERHGHMSHSTHVKVRGWSVRESSVLPQWDPGLEYTLPDLFVGGPCTHWAISLSYGHSLSCQRPAPVGLFTLTIFLRLHRSIHLLLGDPAVSFITTYSILTSWLSLNGFYNSTFI